jgi:diadenosine tetraphosphate (Ap4A) HIT family hydrolase
MDFELHPRLAADTLFVADWALSRVLLMNDARYPWVILVPRRAGLKEVFDLTLDEQFALMAETAHAAKALKALTGAAKMNIGALGNLVPQLHVHVVARKEGDFAWPGPVWGKGEAVPYAEDAAAAFVRQLVNAL